MISESTRPVTVEDLEKLDRRRHAVLWADGTPWGCMIVWPAVVIAAVSAIAAFVAGTKQDWSILSTAAAITAGVVGAIVLWIVGGEWVKLRVLAARRGGRAAAAPALTVIDATATQAWLVLDESKDLGTAPFIVYDVGGGEYLAVHAVLALSLKQHTPTEVPSAVTVTLEPRGAWPLWVEVAGDAIPMADLLTSPISMRPMDQTGVPPVRLRLGQLSPELRDAVMGP